MEHIHLHATVLLCAVWQQRALTAGSLCHSLATLSWCRAATLHRPAPQEKDRQRAKKAKSEQKHKLSFDDFGEDEEEDEDEEQQRGAQVGAARGPWRGGEHSGVQAQRQTWWHRVQCSRSVAGGWVRRCKPACTPRHPLAPPSSRRCSRLLRQQLQMATPAATAPAAPAPGGMPG